MPTEQSVGQHRLLRTPTASQTALYVDLYDFSYQCRVVQHILRSLGSSKLRGLSGNAVIARPIEVREVSISMKFGVRKLG